MKLHELHDNEGANRKKKQVDAAQVPVKVKLAVGGIKGQKSRSA